MYSHKLIHFLKSPFKLYTPINPAPSYMYHKEKLLLELLKSRLLNFREELKEAYYYGL